MLNDAVSIVLFHTFTKFYQNDQQFGAFTVLLAILSFLAVSFASVLVGISIGLACSYLCKHTDIRTYPHYEVLAPRSHTSPAGPSFTLTEAYAAF